MGKKKFTDEQLIQLYEQGLNAFEIAEKLNVTSFTVYYRAKKLGLKFTGRRRRRRSRKIAEEHKKKLVKAVKRYWEQKFKEDIETLRDLLEKRGPMLIQEICKELNWNKIKIRKIIGLNSDIFCKSLIRIGGPNRKYRMKDLFDGFSVSGNNEIVYLIGDLRIIDYIASKIKKPLDRYKVGTLMYYLSRVFGKELARLMIMRTGYFYGEHYLKHCI